MSIGGIETRLTVEFRRVGPKAAGTIKY